MIVLALLIGLLPPAVAGWLALRLLEAKTPMLRPLERMLCGFALGNTLCMLLVFALESALGMPLQWWSILGTEIALIVVLLVPSLRFSSAWAPPLAIHRSAPRWVRFTLGALLAWTVLKIVAGGFMTAQPPPAR